MLSPREHPQKMPASGNQPGTGNESAWILTYCFDNIMV
jgi:hypothetical protein